MNDHAAAVITHEGLAGLIDGLRAEGFRVIGPRLRDQAIVYDDIESIADLPAGWTDEQDGGHYRVRRREDAALFGYNVGPACLEALPASAVAATVAGGADQRRVDGDARRRSRRSATPFSRVRSCELHAIAIQDRVFLHGPYVDPHYQARREGAFIVAVNCGQAGGTCFCVSMNTGPKAQEGFDLSLTELLGERA